VLLCLARCSLKCWFVSVQWARGGVQAAEERRKRDGVRGGQQGRREDTEQLRGRVPLGRRGQHHGERIFRLSNLDFETWDRAIVF
jgi:hypothetical protein